RYEAAQLEFIVSDYESMNFSEPFDCAVFYDSLHHAVDERAALASVYRALRPGGVLITHEPGAGHSTSPDAINAMKLYGVTEKDMPPAHIRDVCAEIGYSDFKFHLDPTQAVIAVYGINMAAMQRVNVIWWRRAVSLIRLLRDRRLRDGGLCVITK
ncbi:MAG: class I SAM-dependent methyltransferase, partial [Burkholderiaceae bacterium]